MGSTILELLSQAEQRLLGVDSSRLSAEVMLAEVLGCSRLSLIVEKDRVLSAEQAAAYDRLLARRETGEPLAYILGNKEFYGLDFRVTPDVLIPRPETEHIVELIEERFDRGAPFRFADLGTGSGILAVMIAHLFPEARGVAVDLSPEALAVARFNADKHKVSGRLAFLHGDFTHNQFDPGSLDLVVSNPPYVTEREMEAASHEVTAFEPSSALVSGVDGLDHIRAMVHPVVNALKSGGLFVLEIGWQQGDAVRDILLDASLDFMNVAVLPDLGGRDRIVVAEKR